MALTRDSLFWNAFTAHADCTRRAADLLLECLEDPKRAPEVWKKIDEIESEGDRITHEIVAALHKTWITPLDREEIHSLITALDDVLDFIDAAGEKLGLYGVAAARPNATAIAKIVVQQLEAMERLIKGLSNVKDASGLLETCKSIRKLEREADSAYRRGVAALFTDGTDPIEIMKWREVFEALENSADSIQDVSDIIEGIVLEHG